MSTIKKFDLKEATKNCREFNPMELHASMIGNFKVMSWGAHSYVNHRNKCYSFQVQANRLKGKIYIVLNGLDLFDVYLCNRLGNVQKVMNDVYVFDLINRIDEEIEKIPDYLF